MDSRSSARSLEPSRAAIILFTTVPAKMKRPARDANWRILIVPRRRHSRKAKALFQTYCAVCHGEQGKGDGPISGKIPPPPSYLSDRLMQFPPGRIFHVITLGTGKMPSYAAQLSADERWKVVTYVQWCCRGMEASHRHEQWRRTMTEYSIDSSSPRIRNLAVSLLAVGSSHCDLRRDCRAGTRLAQSPAERLLHYVGRRVGDVFSGCATGHGARWSASLRRVPEAFLPILPLAALLMLALFFGRHVLYPWSNPGAMAAEPAIAGKLRYLQPQWVFTRMVIVLVTWMVFAWLFRRASVQQDAHPELGLVLHQKLTRYAVVFIPVFALTLTLAAFDWLISTDPSWFSTMYAVYVFAGTFVQGIAAVTLAVVLLKERGPHDGLRERSSAS